MVFWSRMPAPRGNFDIFRMNADGSGQVNLTSENPGADLNAAFSPDGQEIAVGSNYGTDTGAFEIQVMDADGEHWRQLTHSGGIDDLPQYSPDGSRIAFNRFALDSDDGSVWVMDADDGGNQVQLTPDELYGGTPDWSPDGTKIVLVDQFCVFCANSDIWVMNADGSGLKQLTHTPDENEFRPGWSPDGKKIVFASIPWGADNDEPSGPADVYTMTAKGTGRTNITNTPDYQERAPDWGARVNGAPQG